MNLQPDLFAQPVSEARKLERALELVQLPAANHAGRIMATFAMLVRDLPHGCEFTSGDLIELARRRAPVVPVEPRVYGSAMRELARAGLAERLPRTSKTGLLTDCVRSHNGDFAVWRRR